MTIQEIYPQSDYSLQIVARDGRRGVFDVTPYLEYEAFAALKNPEMFQRVVNGGYFIEWECGADLSADTIEARWQQSERRAPKRQKKLSARHVPVA